MEENKIIKEISDTTKFANLFSMTISCSEEELDKLSKSDVLYFKFPEKGIDIEFISKTKTHSMLTRFGNKMKSKYRRKGIWLGMLIGATTVVIIQILVFLLNAGII